MPELDTLHDNDEALKAMYRSDTQDASPLSPEDEQAYRELIEEQRSGYQATQFEKKNETGEVTSEAAPSIGDAALHDTVKVMSPEQQAQAQFFSAAEDWRQPK